MKLMRFCEQMSEEGIQSEVLVFKKGLQSFVAMRSDNNTLALELLDESRGFLGSRDWLKKEVMKFAWDHIKDGEPVYLYDTEFRRANEVETLTAMLALDPKRYAKQIRELSKQSITRQDIIREIRRSGIKIGDHEEFSNLIDEVLSK